MELGVGVRTYVERDCSKELHTVVALSNIEGQTAGGTREGQQRRALATTPQGARRVGVDQLWGPQYETKKSSLHLKPESYV